MAEMNEIFTRIQLKYDSYTAWKTNNPTLLAGEVAIAKLVNENVTIPTDETKNAPVLFKVGPGAFNDLPWVSGLAADVYAWAKKTEAEFTTWAKGLVPVEVIDNGTGKFITDVIATNDANGHHIVITRDDAVNTLTAADDDVVILGVDKATGDVTVTGAHKKYNKAGTTTDANGDATTAGSSVTIKVPTLAVDEYGHTSFNGETSHTITIPSEVAVGDGEITIAAGDGLTTGGAFNTNQDNDETITIDHAIPTGAAAKKYKENDHEGASSYETSIVTSVTTDKFGHVVGAETASGAVHFTARDTFGNGDGIVLSLNGDVVNTDLHETHITGINGIKVKTPTDTNLGDNYPNTQINIDGSDLKKYTDDALQAAKDYADAKPHENTAHTHSNGSGTKVTAVGGVNGDVAVNLNVAFELVDKTIKLYDRDDTTKAAIATLDATEFIADGMLQSVVADEAKNELVFTWNTDAGVTTTTIPFNKIADIYTGKATDEITVAVSNTNEISATLNNGGVTEEKLEQDVQDALALARTALQEHQDISGKKDKQTVVVDKGLTGAKVLKNLSQNENGEIAYETRDLTPADIGAATAAQGSKADTAIQRIVNDGESLDAPITFNFNKLSDGEARMNFWIKDGVIETEHIATDAVTTAKVADKSITKGKLEQSVQDSLTRADGLYDDIWLGEGGVDGPSSSEIVKDALGFGMAPYGGEDKIAKTLFVGLKKDGVTTEAIADKAVTAAKLADDVTPSAIGAATAAQGAKADAAYRDITVNSYETFLDVPGSDFPTFNVRIAHEYAVFDESTGKVDVCVDATVVDDGIKTKHIADNAVTTAKLQGARKSTGTDNTVDIIIFNCGTSTTVL